MKHTPKATKSTRRTRRVLVTLELETALTRDQIGTLANAAFDSSLAQSMADAMGETKPVAPSRIEQIQVNTIRRR